MKKSSWILCLLVYCLPVNCIADGLFYWSTKQIGEDPIPSNGFVNLGDRGDEVVPFELFLYYRPGMYSLRDSFSMDLRFPNYEILDAEIFDYLILGSFHRWGDVDEITIDGDSVFGFGATSSTDPMAYGLSFDVSDEGYDFSTGAYLVGSVTLKGVFTRIEFSNVTATNQAGQELAPRHSDKRH